MVSETDKPSRPLVSFVLMSIAVLSTLGFVLHSVFERRRYSKWFSELEIDGGLPDMTWFFLEMPAPLYVAVFVLFIAFLLVKELAIERKGVTIVLNVLAILAVGGLFACWWIAMPQTFENLGGVF